MMHIIIKKSGKIEEHLKMIQTRNNRDYLHLNDNTYNSNYNNTVVSNKDNSINDNYDKKTVCKDIKDFVPHSAKKLNLWGNIFLVTAVLSIAADFIAMAFESYILLIYFTSLAVIFFILRRVFDACADNVTYNARAQKLIELQTKMML